MGTKQTLLAAVAVTALMPALVKTAVAEQRPQSQEYRNVNYGYAVRLPPGTTIITSEPPAPNHGFGVQLTPTVYLWVDGHHTEDAHNLRETLDEDRQSDPFGGCHELTHGTATLGGQRAFKRVVRCRHESTNDTLVIETELVTFRPNVQYTVGIQRPARERLSPESERVFRAVVDGFRFIPRD